MVLKPLKIRPPGIFCLIILQPDRLSKICMTGFERWSNNINIGGNAQGGVCFFMQNA